MAKGLVDWLAQTEADVVCIQETKAQPDQVDKTPFEKLGYHTYFYSAEKKGYSGVAIFSKIEPNNVVYGMNNPLYDREGRVLQADFDAFTVISVYVPSASNMDRLDYKLAFMADFEKHIKEVKKHHPELVVCGDFNICKEAIDIHDPIRNANVSGFLPEEREWLAGYIKNAQMIDSFRSFNQEPHQYSWWSYRANARNNNKGWRLDYTMVSEDLKDSMVRAYILPEAKHSDHCPVAVELDIN